MSRKASTPKRSSTATLAPSTLHIRIGGLETEHQRLLKQIQKKRTELDNFVEQMRSIAREIYQRTTPCFQKIQVLDEEIHALFKEILSRKKIGKQSKRKIERIYSNLQAAGIISPNEDDEEEDIEFDEEFEPKEEREEYEYSAHESSQYRNRTSELESPSASRSDESKKIRSYFLRLAEIFHPDKANDSETEMRHTEIMKEINKAYQEGDLARLLEIEQQHEVGEMIDTNSEDDLTRKCTRLEQQNQFLKKQHENLKRELRTFKNTPEGSMVSECKRVKKNGFDPFQQISEQMDSQIKIISGIRDYVKEFHSSNMTIKEFLDGPAVLHTLHQNMVEDFVDQMFEDY
jgi:hypothetical protein